MSRDRIAGAGEGAWCESPTERAARIERVRTEIILTEQRLRALFAEET